MSTLILYSRPQCHLCEELLDGLRPLLGEQDHVQVVDISGDAGLERRYSLRIPVLTTGEGVELSGYPLDRECVGRYLAGR